MASVDEYAANDKQLAAMRDESGLYAKVFGTDAGQELLSRWQAFYDGEQRGTNVQETYFNLGRRDLVQEVEHQLETAEKLKTDAGWMDDARGLDK